MLDISKVFVGFPGAKSGGGGGEVAVLCCGGMEVATYVRVRNFDGG